MGKGKGGVDHWIAKISAGTILFEVCGINISLAKSALEVGSNKLSIKTKIIFFSNKPFPLLPLTYFCKANVL